MQRTHNYQQKIDQDILKRLSIVMMDVTGNNADEIYPQAHLEDDLGMNLNEALITLIEAINREFDIKLDLNLVQEELEESGQTVATLAQLIHDELELG